MTDEHTYEYEATYSAEDNSLRLYGPWMDEDIYKEASELGFKYAKIQELYVTKKWTPAREDFCIKLAGEITAEQTTMLDRAEAKADRLDDIANKRACESNSFYRAANQISERFSYGQPILVGHHSERKARKDKDRMDSAMEKAVKAHKAISYWSHRAEGVERHANSKANPGVRSRRIKTLLAELRDRQRDINHANVCLSLWNNVKALTDTDDFDKTVAYYACGQVPTGPAAPQYLNYEDSLWQRLQADSITSTEVVDICLKFHERQANSAYTYRWINHILNHLAYERFEQGEVMPFEGNITKAILQVFARENGAHKPNATKTAKGFKLMSTVALPLHIGDKQDLELTKDEWRVLMQSVGYEVPQPKPKKPSILNFKALGLISTDLGGKTKYPQIEMTKAAYSNIHSDYRGCRSSSCKTFRFKICLHYLPDERHRSWVAVFLSDSKVHKVPESPAVHLHDEEVSNLE